MNKIIPFKKDITFLTDIYDITSISLEHSYKVKENEVNGEFVISGEYIKNLIDEKEPFIYNIPFKTIIDDIYDSSKIKVDIDDFNYNIKNNNTLEVNINLLLDNLVKKEIKEEIKEPEEDLIEVLDNEDRNSEVTSIFNNFDDKDEKYVTYHVHIYRENDDLNKIMTDYKITKEELCEYNNLDNLTIGSKIIIPSNE